MRTLNLSLGVLVCGMLAACDREPPTPAERANQLAQSTMIIDTHVDAPYRLVTEGWRDLSQPAPGADFDQPRARKGGLNAPFMSVYTPADLGDGPQATAHADQVIDLVEKMVAFAPDTFALGYSPEEVEHNFSTGLISLPLGMENGSPLAGSLDNLHHFYQRGVRYITLTHAKSNHIADSSYDDHRPWSGLSPFGEKVVTEMNRLGIMVDVSHLSDDAFWDVLAISRAPVIATHSSMRHYTPGLERNMSDDMLKAMAAKGGLIMINFGSYFLTDRARQAGDAEDAAYEAFLKERSLESSPQTKKAFKAIYDKDHPYPFATLEDVLNHFDRAIAIAGIDHVGIGSDFDGVENTLPVGLKDVSRYPNLVEGLMRRGHTDDDIRKILSGNALRLWRKVEAVATQLQSLEKHP